MKLRKPGSRLLGGTAALLTLAAMGGTGPLSAEAPEAFVPPQSKLLLTRTVVRPLPDGKAVITRRSYAVEIVRDGEGFRVDGRLVDTAVDAPPSLAALAELERQRPDNGLFPIMLDARGMIVGGGGGTDAASLNRAASVAATQLAGSGLATPQLREAETFVAQVKQRAPRSQWPVDIFHPVPGRRSEQQALALPAGGDGKVTIEIVASGPVAGGRIAALERIVTTEIAGDRRVSREKWQLSSAPR